MVTRSMPSGNSFVPLFLPFQSQLWMCKVVPVSWATTLGAMKPPRACFWPFWYLGGEGVPAWGVFHPFGGGLSPI